MNANASPFAQSRDRRFMVTRHSLNESAAIIKETDSLDATWMVPTSESPQLAVMLSPDSSAERAHFLTVDWTRTDRVVLERE